jgi:ribonuclease T1
MVVTVAKASTLVAATQIPIAASLTETPARVSSVTSVKTTVPNTKTPIPRSPTSLAAQVDCKKTLVGGRTPKIPKITLTILIACRPQVNDTLKAIGIGKFSYSQDDQTFGNFEAYLPNAARGIYREYTVVTPSEGDRGARRLITSGDPSRKPAAYNTLYYTDDHYDTFWQVVTRN